MIDDFSTEELRDPSNVKRAIKNIKGTVKNIEDKVSNIDDVIENDEKGLKILVHDLIKDVNTLDEKVGDLLDNQKDTRKTVKNVIIGGGVGAAVTSVVTFVVEQLGKWG